MFFVARSEQKKQSCCRKQQGPKTLRCGRNLSLGKILALPWFALLSYQKDPPTLAERTKEQITVETARQMAMRRDPLE
jgi:hypothetical protein